MPDTEDAKRMARALRDALATQAVTLTHSQSLELIAKTLGHADWNTLSAKSADPPLGDRSTGADLMDAIPILRMFDVEKAKAFYVDLLGFKLDWEHRFEPGYPLYMQVSRDGLRLHLSEHHGDATPGSVVYIHLKGLDALHAELAARGSRAHIEPGPNPDSRMLSLWDPFGNRLRFAERSAAPADKLPRGHRIAST